MKESGKSAFGSMQTTTLFRITNFELFAKPNKYVMGVGLVAITACVSYIAYMNVREKSALEISSITEKRDSGSTTATVSKWN